MSKASKATAAWRAGIAALMIALGASDAAAEPLSLLCRGNEPFWSLAIDGPTATLKRLMATVTDEPLVGGVNSADYLDPPGTVWRGRAATANDNKGDLVAVITETRCADTMADRTYSHRAILSLPDGTLLIGCCEDSIAK